MDEITIGEKTYISSKQAAKITGYAKDYVGQLCREGRVEARLVGRNWYVLDTAIREHRFGKEEQEHIAPKEALDAGLVQDRASAWKKPQYEAEIPVLVPNFSGKAAETVGAPAIADMQTAWKEWFQDRQPVKDDAFSDFSASSQVLEQETVSVTLLEETPEPMQVESKALHEEESVQVSRIQDSGAATVSEESENDSVELVDIHRIYATKPVEVQRHPRMTTAAASNRAVKTTRAKEGGVGAVVLQAVLIVVSVAVALVALIGTGHADQYLAGTSLDFGAQKQVVDYLGGKSFYESSL